MCSLTFESRFRSRLTQKTKRRDDELLHSRVQLLYPEVAAVLVSVTMPIRSTAERPITCSRWLTHDPA